MQSDYVLGSRDTSRVAIQRKTGSLLWQIVEEKGPAMAFTSGLDE